MAGVAAYSASFNHFKSNSVLNDENAHPSLGVKKKLSEKAAPAASSAPGLKPRTALGDISNNNNVNNNNNNGSRPLKQLKLELTVNEKCLQSAASQVRPKRNIKKKAKLRPADNDAAETSEETIDWSQVPIDHCSKYYPVRQPKPSPAARDKIGGLDLNLVLSECATPDELFSMPRYCAKAENFLFGDKQKPEPSDEDVQRFAHLSASSCLTHLDGLLTRFDREEEARFERVFAEWDAQPVDETELFRQFEPADWEIYTPPPSFASP
eukprot:gnl/Hemi2/4362_TR1535_c0_g1_i1.p1 gnl/Hemi2/4362_TR1535_c0_g1~~gnl/Hemi2/4362_TR1535_c0_g1_i1.p1  ORF type:complete len:267 (+),score=61.82 gnl/Hemi2/4362_TR1535_c0_g1_i1:100-900(+)